jgi:hypothetical protein
MINAVGMVALLVFHNVICDACLMVIDGILLSLAMEKEAINHHHQAIK